MSPTVPTGVDVTPIPTRYAGCHFRSRLEARWAVFFDTLGIRWEYEPQGFSWPAGTDESHEWFGPEPVRGGSYLPDFWLPSISTWFEVKGASATSEECRIHYEFALVTRQRHITAEGGIPKAINELTGDRGDGRFLLDGGADHHYLWCVCPWCGKPGIEFDGRGARVCGYRSHHPSEEAAAADPRFDRARHWRVDDKCYTYDDPRITGAYAAARSARFEHGHSGAS